MTTPLQIRLLGVPTVTFQERPLKFRSRKVLALLVYLLVTGERHNRNSLMALLWPESDPKRASASLRSTVARLRRALAVAGEFIVTEPGVVSFDFERPSSLDLHLLGTAVHPDATPDDMQAALTAVRGEFLDGFSLPDAPGFDNWATIQREAWQRHLETIYERLTRRLLTAGEGREALRAAEQWVARAPLSEAAYRTLMESHFLSGDRAAALRVYGRCAQMLHDELSLEPSADTFALAERIRKEEGRRMKDEERALPSAFQELPLVGRAAEHTQLAALYREVVRGETQVTAVIGEAGIGKTRLVGAFLAWAALAASAADVLQGRAFEAGGRLPYQPLVDALRTRLEAENAPEDLLADVWLAELSQLLPELRDRYPDLPLPMSGDPDFVRARIFEAVSRLLAALAARRLVILFVDDLQWAGAGTLDMLHYLARRWTEEKTPILLLLTARQENMAGLRDWLARLSRETSLTQIHLEPLPVTAVQKLVGVLTGESAEGETAVQSFGGWLQAETGGVPFFMEAMLQMLVEQGILPQEQRHGRAYLDVTAVWRQIQSAERLPVPPSVREVVLSRLNRLSDMARSLLLAGAVIGRECSFERLCQLSGVGEEDGLMALEELLNGRLLLEKSRATRPYRFAHDNIRQVIYTEAGEARRRLVHRRALTVLQQEDAPAAELAYHALAIRQDDLAFRYSLAAGDDALAAHVLAEAIAHYDRAREIAAAVAIETDLLCQLYTCRGRALELNNQFDEALANYREMAELGKQRDDEALELASLTAQCIVQATQTPLYNPSEARILGAKALTLARKLGDQTTKAKVLWGLLLVEVWGGGDYQQASVYGQQSLAISRELDLREQMAFTLTSLSTLYYNLDQIETGLAAILEARPIWLELSNIPMLADAYNLAAWLYMFAGDFEAALVTAREGIPISESIGNVWNHAGMLVAMGEIYAERGEIGLAIVHLEQGKQMAAEAGIPYLKFAACNYLILTYLTAGAVDQANRLADELYAVRDTIVFNFRMLALGFIVQAKASCGELQQAQHTLEQAYQGLDIGQQAIYLFGPLLLAEAHLQLALGKPGDAMERLAYLTGRVRRAGVLLYLPEALWLQGKALLALNKPEEARPVFLEARAAAEETGARRVLWRILGALWELETAVHRLTAANEYRQQAQEIITTIANHAGSDELRASFLNRPDVKESRLR